jgi:hypothetical protein
MFYVFVVAQMNDRNKETNLSHSHKGMMIYINAIPVSDCYINTVPATLDVPTPSLLLCSYWLAKTTRGAKPILDCDR